MKPFDRALALSAGVLGVLVFVLTLQGGMAHPERPWEIPLGIACLIVGLTCASFVAYRGRPR